MLTSGALRKSDFQLNGLQGWKSGFQSSELQGWKSGFQLGELQDCFLNGQEPEYFACLLPGGEVTLPSAGVRWLLLQVYQHFDGAEL